MWSTFSRTTSILVNSKFSILCSYSVGGCKNSLIFALSRFWPLSDIVTDYRMAAVENLVKNTKLADSLIAEISEKIQKMSPNVEIEKLKVTNEELRKEVQKWKEILTVAEILHGQEPVYYWHSTKPEGADVPQVTTDKKASPEAAASASESTENKDQGEGEKKDQPKGKKNKSNENKKPETDVNANANETSEDTGSKPAKQAKTKAPPKSPGNSAPAAVEVVDVSRLDFRIGKIVDVEKHPEADSLYLEKIDVGEAQPRTVISGLVKFVPIENMKDRLVVLLCNLKPAKMRGITSEAMVMCASTPEKVEILVPPPGVVPGDVVDFEGYTRNPDPVLNPKKKIFETVAPDLKTDVNKIATYKGIPFTVKGKGNVVAESLAEVNIK